MSTTFADKSGRGLLFAALNRAAAAKGFQFAKTDLEFGPVVEAETGDRESQFTYSATPNSRFEGSAVGYFNRIDLTGLFSSAGIESVELKQGPTTVAQLVAALNARYGLGFDNEDIADFANEIPAESVAFTLVAKAGSYGFKGQLNINLVEAKTPLEDIVDQPIDPVIEVVVPEYLTENTTTTAGVAPKAQKQDGTLLTGSGNPSGEMTVSNNGELELALGARVWKSGDLPPANQGHYDIVISDDANGDWNWPFSIALLQEDRPVTDLYDITLKLQAVETNAELVFALSRDDEGGYHFANEEAGLDITDSVQTESGSVIQNIQRVTFYKSHLGELATNSAGAPVGDYIISLNAVRREGLVEPLSVEISASVSVQQPV